MSPASGDAETAGTVFADGIDVSIQLMSPASGDWMEGNASIKPEVSIQLMSPASGDKMETTMTVDGYTYHVSIQLMSPASGDTYTTCGHSGISDFSFPFN
jgi:hypothetical protein